MLVMSEAELLGLLFFFSFFSSIVTTREEEAQQQMKEVTAPREKLNVWKMELQLAEQCVDEVERTVAGMLMKDHKYIHRNI